MAGVSGHSPQNAVAPSRRPHLLVRAIVELIGSGNKFVRWWKHDAPLFEPLEYSAFRHLGSELVVSIERLESTWASFRFLCKSHRCFYAYF